MGNSVLYTVQSLSRAFKSSQCADDERSAWRHTRMAQLLHFSSRVYAAAVIYKRRCKETVECRRWMAHERLSRSIGLFGLGEWRRGPERIFRLYTSTKAKPGMPPLTGSSEDRRVPWLYDEKCLAKGDDEYKRERQRDPKEKEKKKKMEIVLMEKGNNPHFLSYSTR